MFRVSHIFDTADESFENSLNVELIRIFHEGGTVKDIKYSTGADEMDCYFGAIIIWEEEH